VLFGFWWIINPFYLTVLSALTLAIYKSGWIGWNRIFTTISRHIQAREKIAPGATPRSSTRHLKSW
jgi:hypothetical protein